MDNVATMPAERRLELFRETAARRSLSVELIEKDFWVCWSLHRLSSRMADLPATLLFKGGTSLSKVFSAIERFSEDVDLSLNREDLGFGDERDPYIAASKKQARRLIDRFLEGDISEDEGKRVLAWLEIDADNMARFAGRAELHADLRRSLRRRSIQSEAMATMEHFPAESRSEPFACGRMTRRRSLALALAVAALTAAVTLAFVLFRMDDVPRAQNAPPSIAALAYHSNAHWDEDDKTLTRRIA